MPDIDISVIILQYLCLLFSLSVHEASHAAMANYWGDPTARLMGRMTLNPVKHADIMGTVVLPIFAMISGLPMFGWAKPVPFNPRNLTDRRRGPVWIALAGPGSNLLLILLAAIVLRALAASANVFPDSTVLMTFVQAFLFLAIINSILMLFNLIPLPPLDGHHVLQYFLSPEAQKKFESLGPFSLIILFILVFQFNILEIPMGIMTKLVMYLAFYGTPLWQ
ncbi:MAG: site-2 protease family protein [Candidatus Hydrogenedentes bacterium]|nr:site-2 protease family protein [Candidatus Hydrogenedentota bacterium]